jgi:putative transposase
MINLHGPWRGVADVEVAAFEWVDFFNNERPHEYLDDLTPAESEKLHYDHFTPTLATAG